MVVSLPLFYCQSSGTTKGTYRSATAVVQYIDQNGSPDDNGRLDGGNSGRSGGDSGDGDDGSGFLENMFAFVCNASNRWEPNPTQPGPIQPPLSFALNLTMCSFCTLTPTSFANTSCICEL